MWSVTGYHSLISVLVILVPSLALEELARHRSLGTISRVSYSDSGQCLDEDFVKATNW